MRLKSKSEKKTEFIGIRMSTEDLNKIKQRALLYCDGNVSEFVLYAALNYNIKAQDLVDESKTKKGTPKSAQKS